jgi:hypothetical protein
MPADIPMDIEGLTEFGRSFVPVDLDLLEGYLQGNGLTVDPDMRNILGYLNGGAGYALPQHLLEQRGMMRLMVLSEGVRPIAPQAISEKLGTLEGMGIVIEKLLGVERKTGFVPRHIYGFDFTDAVRAICESPE